MAMRSQLPDRDARSSDATDHRVGGDAIPTAIAAGDECDECGQHERRTDALEDRPADRQQENVLVKAIETGDKRQ